jgi:hypothetical protein
MVPIALELYVDAPRIEKWFGNGGTNTNIDPTDYICGCVPFKQRSQDKRNATKSYAEEHRRGEAAGPPRLLLEAELTADNFAAHVLSGSMLVNPYLGTVACTQSMTADMFAAFKWAATPIDAERGAETLKQGYRLLEQDLQLRREALSGVWSQYMQ